ncbi:carboxypeptidase-like regulatory domain-containing protein [Flavobacterium silvaticum]|uniref:Carboxypeptidase-like regulatory domain-containing protein n=1 Tax=Flavobacterium silvaticum TaxID=1852020 RepID=A0A972FQG3_9FLAO|nr:carboxypeptidase-like regulatory domain-containing protein [Flavobacterium silvaticum]NMH27499.1 carboxypeptidase-like regulatory domain-containing protein [Flavobacterium silvaticum]
MKKVSLILLFVFCVFLGNAQEKMIRGKVFSDEGIAIGVQVMNLVNEKTAVSDGNGYFEIPAKEEDLIIFPSVAYEYKRYTITHNDYATGEFNLKLIKKPEQLEEVVVLQNINPESLGIVPKGQKINTPAEKKLYAAKSGPLDLLINTLSGRIKMARKVVATEKKERLLAKLDAMFPDDYYEKQLHIPADYIDGFRYYCVEFQDVAEAVELNNKIRTSLALAELSAEYVKIINETETAMPKEKPGKE